MPEADCPHCLKKVNHADYLSQKHGQQHACGIHLTLLGGAECDHVIDENGNLFCVADKSKPPQFIMKLEPSQIPDFLSSCGANCAKPNAPRAQIIGLQGNVRERAKLAFKRRG